MQPKLAQDDPFDLGFDADDEFNAPPNAQDAWRETQFEDDDPGTPHPDPFVGLPREPEAAEGQAASPFGLASGPVAAEPEAAESSPAPYGDLSAQLPETAPDPFADLPPPETRSASLDYDDLDTPDDDEIIARATAPSPAASNPVGDLIAHAAAALGEPVVPRITIHAFCMLEETGELVRAAAGDRRMERASTVVRMGGLAAAAEHYQTAPTPSLIIVESGDSGQGMLSLLDRLAEVCDPGTKVVVIGQTNDIALYRELIRRGVSEYLVPPMQT
jgi:pilus assembly protein CpaE